MTEATSSLGDYTAPFGDAIHTFRMDIAGLRELQDKTDAGPAFLLARIMGGQWRIDDLRETLRIGLVRGGMDPVKAMVLMERYFDPFPKMQFVGIAGLILGAALYEPEAIDQPGKTQPNGTTSAPVSRSAN